MLLSCQFYFRNGINMLKSNLKVISKNHRRLKVENGSLQADNMSLQKALVKLDIKRKIQVSTLIIVASTPAPASALTPAPVSALAPALNIIVIGQENSEELDTEI